MKELMNDEILKNAVCAICERRDGEDGTELTMIWTPQCVVPLCKWPCAYVSKTHCFMKCRKCGMVMTILKSRIPGGLALGENAFIMFVEDCEYHKKEGVKWPARIAKLD